MERNDVITTLEVLRANCSRHSRDYQALGYAISSLKTDEAYQIMYEGGEIFTKADMVDMLTEIQLEIEECVDGGEGSPLFEQGVDIARCQVVDIIQQKINDLKENTDGRN